MRSFAASSTSSLTQRRSSCSRLQGHCGPAPAIAEAHEAFFAALDRYTLADVLPRGAAVKFKGWPEGRGKIVSAPTRRTGTAT
jgi:DNA-binding IscR family transcriptional regulator